MTNRIQADSVEVLYIHISEIGAGNRLDKTIADHFKRFSRQEARRLIESGAVFINRRRIRKMSYIVQTGDRIRIHEMPDRMDRSIGIIYEDDWICVIDKPPDVFSDSTPAGDTNTVASLLMRARGLRVKLEPVHRLDLGVSGLLVLAKKKPALRNLMEQFRNRTAEKEYLAWTEGLVKKDSGLIETYLCRDPKDVRKSRIRDEKETGARLARTGFAVLARDSAMNRSFIWIRLLTGKRHQIRIHMAHMGHPVVGDRLYGASRPESRILLHAWRLGLKHPVSNEWMKLEAPCPFVPHGFDLKKIPYPDRETCHEDHL